MTKFQRTFDNEHDVAILDVIGIPAVAEWTAAIEECLQDERLLIDVSGSEFFSLDANQLAELAHKSRQRLRPSESRVAMVAEEDAEYGVARRWSVLREAPNVTAAAFRTRHEAIDWLKALGQLDG